MTLSFVSGSCEYLAQIGQRDAVVLLLEVLQRAEDLLHFFDVRILAGQEVVLDARVALAVEQQAERFLAVAAGPAGFLRVRFDAARQIVVDDEADVRLVDAEAERIGGDDDPDFFAHEAIVDAIAVGFLQLAVVDVGFDAAAASRRYSDTAYVFLIVAV